MTNDELREHFARIAVAQDRTDAQIAGNAAQLKQLAETTAAQMAKTDAQMAKTDAKLKRLAETTAAQQAETAAQQAETAAQQAETAAQQAETAAQQAKTDAKLAKTDAKLNRLADMYGGVGNNQGAVAEEFFYNSLKADPVLGGVRFDIVYKNMTGERSGLEDEFDLLLVNGRSVLVVEVKYKAHENDLRRLLDTKAHNFRRLFPEYADREQALALAAFHVHDELKRAALQQGVTVLQRKGDMIETAAA